MATRPQNFENHTRYFPLFHFVAAPLLELIDAHTFDLYDEPMATVGELELYGIQTQSPLFAMARYFCPE